MVEMGKDMVKQCAGLPLAIVALGGILATKDSLNDWQTVHKNVKSHLRRGGVWGIHETLALSYDDLPAYLKSCFLYLSIFPEDYEIPAAKLIQLWVAEDLVSPDGEEMVEDVAEHYLNELVERYMVQVGKRDASFKIKTCRMHDLVRDLCLLKAKQQNFLYIIDGLKMEQIGASILSSEIGKTTFSEISSHSKFLDDFVRQNRPIEDLRLILTLRLRVLNFLKTSAMGCKIVSDIGCLIHLRFLSLGDSVLLRLPSSLSKLRCLITLDLSLSQGYEGMGLPIQVHVPNVIWKMQQLRHLYLPRKCDRKTKLKLGNLRNLQTLVNFNTKNCYVEDLSRMKYLKELGICTPFKVEDFREDLAMNPLITTKHLRSLSVESEERTDPRHLKYLLTGCVNVYELSLSAEINKLPDLQQISQSIAYISLSRSRLDEDPMPTLEKLPKLRILELNEDVFIGMVMICSATGFLRLESSTISSHINLEELRVSQGAMSYLRILKIADCRKLKMLPDELRFITALKELKIEKMPKAFKDKLVQGGEDHYKVQHIPSIIFRDCDD
ncbi:hypothetical protein PTKIN_Ptkin02bG0207300 [Pterospermum kingtungense]